MKYKTAGAFRHALEERLRNQSLETDQTLTRLRKLVAFDRFLARLAKKEPGAWIVKGGFALQLRLGNRARTTDVSVKGLALGGERGIASKLTRVTPDRRAGPGDESPAARFEVQELKVALPWWHPRPLAADEIPSLV